MLQEAEIALAALVYIAARVRQYASWEEFLDRLFFLAKAVSLLLLYMTDSTAALRWGIVAGRTCQAVCVPRARLPHTPRHPPVRSAFLHGPATGLRRGFRGGVPRAHGSGSAGVPGTCRGDMAGPLLCRLV